MKFYLKVLLILIVSNSPQLLATVDKKMVIIPSEELYHKMFINRSVSLAQVKVFNKNGVLLYGTNKADNALKSNLILGILAKNKQGKNQLTQHLENITDKDGNQLNLDNSRYDLIIVQCYVAWFSDSLEQENIVAEFTDSILNQNEFDVLWLVVDVDPHRIGNAGHD